MTSTQKKIHRTIHIYIDGPLCSSSCPFLNHLKHATAFCDLYPPRTPRAMRKPLGYDPTNGRYTRHPACRLDAGANATRKDDDRP
jgi:hypothetical protein